MPEALTFLLVPAIAFFSWSCGRSHGWSGFCVFLGGLGAVMIGALMTSVGGDTGQGGSVSMVAVIAAAGLLAAVSGVLGVAKRNAFLQSAGVKSPKSG